MPIYSKDTGILDKAAWDSIASDKANSQAEKMAKLQQQLDVQKEQAKQDQGVKTIQSLQQIAPKGAGVSAGDTRITPDNLTPAMMRMQHQQMNQERSDFGSIEKIAKPLSGVQGELEHVRYMHNLLDNPSQIDQGTFNALKGLAAAGGSGSRALGAIMKAQGTDMGTLNGTYENFKNYMSGAANTTRSPEQLQAARDSTFKYQDEVAQRYNDAKTQFQTLAPSAAPNLAAGGKLDSIIGAHTMAGDNILSGLNQRKQDYMQKQQQGANPGPSTLQPPQGNPGAANPVDKIKSYLGGLFSPSQPAQQQQAAPAQPAMSFEEFKKRKAAGQL